MIMEWFRKEFTKWKMRVNYASGTVTMFGVVFLLSNLIQEKLVVLGIDINYFVILFIMSAGIVVLSYYLDVKGFMTSELNQALERNTLLKEWIKNEKTDKK